MSLRLERGGYGFSIKEKQEVRKRASGSCEHSSCPRPNTGRVNHLTGILEGKVKGMPKRWIRDAKENAVMQCEVHEIKHDLAEKENIIYERKRITRIIGTPHIRIRGK